TGAAVSVDITDQAVRGPKGHVVAGDPFLPPIRFDTPAAQLLHHSVAMPRDDQGNELALVPDQLRRQRFGEEPHEVSTLSATVRNSEFSKLVIEFRSWQRLHPSSRFAATARSLCRRRSGVACARPRVMS